MIYLTHQKKLVLQRSLIFVAVIGSMFALVHWSQHRPPLGGNGPQFHHEPGFNKPNESIHSDVPATKPPYQRFTTNIDTNDIVSPLDIAENTFLILKTGVDVCHSRVPSHIESTLKWFPNHVIYADGSANVNGEEVIDIISYIPTENLRGSGLEGYITRQEANQMRWGWGFNPVKYGGSNVGWNLDRFKNIPGFAHAWVNNPGFDWYLMIDGDSMIYPSTLSAATVNMNPNDLHFLGRDVGWFHMFPHGGSGLLMSRGAMEKVYGNDEESAMATVAKYISRVPGDCCGDQAFANMVFEYYEHSKDDLEFQMDNGFFQGGRPTEQKSAFSFWCQPIGTFHHLRNWEVQMLGNWYEDLLEKHKDRRYLPTYFDYYRDFILPHVVDEIPGWFMHFRSEDGMKGNHNCLFKGDDEEAKSKQNCKSACEKRDDCYAWSFRKVGECELIDLGVVSGRALNPASSEWKDEFKDCASGFMVDRIKKARQKQVCDPAFEDPEFNFQEGWLQKTKFDSDKATESRRLKNNS